jgi:hypothetical protein
MERHRKGGDGSGLLSPPIGDLNGLRGVSTVSTDTMLTTHRRQNEAGTRVADKTELCRWRNVSSVRDTYEDDRGSERENYPATAQGPFPFSLLEAFGSACITFTWTWTQ